MWRFFYLHGTYTYLVDIILILLVSGFSVYWDRKYELLPLYSFFKNDISSEKNLKVELSNSIYYDRVPV